jgi:hypothetical protein
MKHSGLLSLVASLHPAQALHLRASSNNATSKKNDHAPTNESLAVLRWTGPKRTKCITLCDTPLPSLSSHNKQHTNNLNKNYNRVSYGNSEFSHRHSYSIHMHLVSYKLACDTISCQQTCFLRACQFICIQGHKTIHARATSSILWITSFSCCCCLQWPRSHVVDTTD